VKTAVNYNKDLVAYPLESSGYETCDHPDIDRHI